MNHNQQLSDIVKELKDYCAANADSRIVEKYSRYFKDGYIAYGLTEELINKKKKDILDRYSNLGLSGFLDLGDILIEGVKYEESSFAILFLEEFEKEFDKETFNRVSRWFDIGVHNWAHCDVICGRLISSFCQKKIIEINDLDKWRCSENFYKRRAVPVSLIYFLKYQDNYQRMLEFITPLLQDEARTVQQGLGWFLRELWKKVPDIVETFLFEIKDTAPRMIIQYATEKMDPDQKARFKKEKKN